MMNQIQLKEKGFVQKSFEEGLFWVYEIDDESVVQKLAELPSLKADNEFYFDEFSCIILMVSEGGSIMQLWNVDTDEIVELNEKEFERACGFLD